MLKNGEEKGEDSSIRCTRSFRSTEVFGFVVVVAAAVVAASGTVHQNCSMRLMQKLDDGIIDSSNTDSFTGALKVP